MTFDQLLKTRTEQRDHAETVRLQKEAQRKAALQQARFKLEMGIMERAKSLIPAALKRTCTVAPSDVVMYKKHGTYSHYLIFFSMTPDSPINTKPEYADTFSDNLFYLIYHAAFAVDPASYPDMLRLDPATYGERFTFERSSSQVSKLKTTPQWVENMHSFDAAKLEEQDLLAKILDAYDGLQPQDAF